MACGNWWNLTEMNIANYVIICFCSVVFLCVFFFGGEELDFMSFKEIHNRYTCS